MQKKNNEQHKNKERKVLVGKGDVGVSGEGRSGTVASGLVCRAEEKKKAPNLRIRPIATGFPKGE